MQYAVFGAGPTGLYIARDISTRSDVEKDKVHLIGRQPKDEMLKHILISDKSNIIYHHDDEYAFTADVDKVIFCTDDDLGAVASVESLATQITRDLDRMINRISGVHWQGTFILISSDSVYGTKENELFSENMNSLNLTKPSWYEEAKIAQEFVVKSAPYNISVIVLRPSVIYGSGFNTLIDELAYAAISGKGIEVNPGKRDYIHISDFCAAVWAALNTKETGIFNIGSGTAINNEVLARVINVRANSNKNKLEPRSQLIVSRAKVDKFIVPDLTKMHEVLKVTAYRDLHAGIVSILLRLIDDLPLDSHTHDILIKDITEGQPTETISF